MIWGGGLRPPPINHRGGGLRPPLQLFMVSPDGPKTAPQTAPQTAAQTAPRQPQDSPLNPHLLKPHVSSLHLGDPPGWNPWGTLWGTFYPGYVRDFRFILSPPDVRSPVQSVSGPDAPTGWPVASNPDPVTLPGLDQNSSKSTGRDPPEIKP